MRYDSRELSFLQFNARVMSEAENPKNPLLERARFLSIVSSNLDEFFMVRIAALREKVLSGDHKPDPGGTTPAQNLKRSLQRVRAQVKKQYRIYHNRILPRLAERGIHLFSARDLDTTALSELENHFTETVAPQLTLYRVDRVRAFPLLLSRTLSLCVLLGPCGEQGSVVIRVPTKLPRITMLGAAPEQTYGVLLEDEIAYFVDRLLPNESVYACRPFRITRDADASYVDDESHNLLAEMEKSLRRRKWGSVTRLELPMNAEPALQRFLVRALRMDERAVYNVDGPLHLDFLGKQIYALPDMDDARYPAYTPTPLSAPRGMFARIAAGDVFLFHPYDSFEPVVRLIEEAADDPLVLSIRQALYRVSGHSPIVAALARAAQQGKQVTVLMEVRARFDEENNIGWGKQLEQAGCQVLYGLPRLKTHAKIALVLRSEAHGVRGYMHLGTGNYNDSTARFYTDMGLMTADPALCADGAALFGQMTGYGVTPPLRKLISAPGMLRGALAALIQREITNARAGRVSGITAKMNALVDPDMIVLLYRASQAGVQVRLIVRGACCLRPGIKGLSEHITVKSIVGRYLEHARVYMFRNNGKPEVYLSSADLMKRNLDRRVELMFPVADSQIARRIAHILTSQLRDNQQSWLLTCNRKYERVSPEPDEAPYSTQNAMMAGEYRQ